MAPDDIIYSGLNPTDMQPYVDGVTIPAQPLSIGPQVPMIFGSNNDEGGLFTLGTYDTILLSEANYSSFLTANFGPAASIVAKQYPLTLPAFNSSKFPAFTAVSTIITQAQFLCPAYQALLKAQSNNIPVYTYLNSHVPSCQWLSSLAPPVIPFVGATHTSELPYVFGNGYSNGNCTFSSQEKVISENLIAAWSAMASNGNPSVQGGLQWPQWNSTASMGVTIVNATTVGVVDYSPCAFWDMINNQYLNFTSLGTNDTSGNVSTVNGTAKPSGVERRVEMRYWGLTLAVGIAVSVLMR
jgi:carboxylesterase type B